ncbi:ArsR/SmtB family transcription factor [Methylovirgula sp. 4M-Z18]|uniref:ArsR/SmtB family transcription factor n=1 Tax=Methylovirgula sp. 4M-Z18 TaxID=2293567 RepID=UPI000E2F1AF6|nr:metalloregulator ArsR/SmtB family transcription factor [Methylovirgula sp. 4M-Z18]RFB79930.1 methyltransferase domain-containing protein [Methylovirgula sp. 4M-Z18]
MPAAAHASLDTILAGLAAAGEVTRLRLLVLLAEVELTVSELVAILGQSQPRVSRHLKLLAESGLVTRHREGAWAFFRLADRGAAAGLARDAIARIDPNDPVIAADRARLVGIREQRAAIAARYFASQAADWDRVRSLHAPEAEVEACIADIIGDGHFHAVLDLGTGTGRMLELLAPRADRAVGIDQSPAMLNVARARLEQANLRNVQLRQGDIHALPVERNAYDIVIVHQVLHYLDEPGRALREAARTLCAGGRLIVVDFAPHELESLREDHAHRRLGFAREDIESFMRDAGLEVLAHHDLAPPKGVREKLTVSIWVGRDRRVISDVHVLNSEVA